MCPQGSENKQKFERSFNVFVLNFDRIVRNEQHHGCNAVCSSHSSHEWGNSHCDWQVYEDLHCEPFHHLGEKLKGLLIFVVNTWCLGLLIFVSTMHSKSPTSIRRSKFFPRHSPQFPTEQRGGRTAPKANSYLYH